MLRPLPPQGMYDFFYLPIDFKNKCNVGYAFLNVVQPAFIVPLVERLHNRRWERFNSEKVRRPVVCDSRGGFSGGSIAGSGSKAKRCGRWWFVPWFIHSTVK